MTKVDIISGFLGAGKTTLIKKLIQEVYSGQQIVLIENEFGEIGIDGGFLKDVGINISEMNSGCICCSLVGDFGKALKEVTEKFHPDRILIEPSGVGKLSDVRIAVENAAEDADLVVNSLITVADASKIKVYMKNFGEFYSNQVENAGTVILSRTQKLSEEKQLKAAEMIRVKNPDAVIITTPWEQLTGQQILDAVEGTNSLAKELMKEEHEHHHHEHHDHEECGHDHEHDHHHHHEHDDDCSCGCGHDHGHHHADEVFTSWGKETPRKYTKAELENILDILCEAAEYGIILRAKGMVPSADTEGEWYHFDFVPGEYEVRTGTPDYTGRICVIGSKLREEALAELFLLRV